MEADVTFNDLGHEGIHSAAAGGNIVQHGGALGLVVELAFDSFHLAADAPDAV
jgi:hypothetical protein